MIPRPSGQHDIKRVELHDRSGCVLFKIAEDLTVNSTFDALTKKVRKSLDEGKANIVFSFTEGSYLNTRLISNLVQYWNLSRDRGGSLGLVRPNEEIVSVLRTIGLLDLMTIYDSEDDVGAA